MELTKIEIQNYKSIKSPVTISFSKNLPTVLIGKNGSGKTNVLEALSAIAMANGTSMPVREEKEISYCAYIQLSKEDTNEEKADHFPHWKANGRHFRAERVKGSRTDYKITEL